MPSRKCLRDGIVCATLATVIQTTRTLLTAEEVAEIFRVSRRTVSRWAREHTIPSVKVGATVRFHRADVEALLSTREVPDEEADEAAS